MNWKHLSVGVSAVLLGGVGSHVWANATDGADKPSANDIAVAAALKDRLPKTQVSRVNCQVVDGICEVTAGSQLFYVDKSGRYLVIGRVYDMQTRQDLTAVRLLEVNPDLLVGGAAGSRREEETVAAPAPRHGDACIAGARVPPDDVAGVTARSWRHRLGEYDGANGNGLLGLSLQLLQGFVVNA
jgi:hypothetical protein